MWCCKTGLSLRENRKICKYENWTQKICQLVFTILSRIIIVATESHDWRLFEINSHILKNITKITYDVIFLSDENLFADLNSPLRTKPDYLHPSTSSKSVYEYVRNFIIVIYGHKFCRFSGHNKWDAFRVGYVLWHEKDTSDFKNIYIFTCRGLWRHKTDLCYMLWFNLILG